MKEPGNTETFSYDRVVYPGHAYQETHPDLLATIGTLLGMEPPNVSNCRVLEIGCGDGSNIIPMAVSLGTSEFIGLDLAASSINQAQRVIEQAAIKNVKVLAMDLMDFPATLGMFDYIIAHGFYSWVPRALQLKLLSVCHEHLTSNGIAFISYNTYPAAHFRSALRDIMLFRNDRAAASHDTVRRAKTSIQCVLDCMEEKNTWKAVLQDELNRISKRDDRVTFHDELSPHYCPVLFVDFVKSAEDHNLQFLSEASLQHAIGSIKPELQQKLQDIGCTDFIAQSQYLDFIQFRGLHRTLLCRRGIQVQRQTTRERLDKLLIACPMHEVSRSGQKITFKNRYGPGFVETDHPIMTAAIRGLEGKWPKAQSFIDLSRDVIATVEAVGDGDSCSTLKDVVFALVANMLLTLRTHEPPLSRGTEDVPVASPLARLQAKDKGTITTLLHSEIEIEDDVVRNFLRIVDGKHNRQDLKAWLLRLKPQLSSKVASEQVISYLEEFGRLGLLLAI